MKTSTSLLRRVVALEPGSWDQFHAVYRPVLSAYLKKQGVYDADLEDLVQDIMLKLLRAFGWTGDEPSTGEAPRQAGFQLEKLRDEQGNWRCKFRTWLYTVTKNAYIAWRKKSAVVGRAFASLEIDPVAESSEDVGWVQAYRMGIVEAVCKELQPTIEAKTWNCFAEHVLKHRPSTDVATEMGIKANTVTQNARRVLLKVIQIVRTEYEEELGDSLAS